MSMIEEGTQISLGRAEALVLFEMLADFHSQPCLHIHSEAGRLALVRLQSALEQTLVEPFMPEYPRLVDEARLNLIEQFSV